jgi:hypothetical protein
MLQLKNLSCDRNEGLIWSPEALATARRQ